MINKRKINVTESRKAVWLRTGLDKSFGSNREGMRLPGSAAGEDANHCGRIAPRDHRAADRDYKGKKSSWATTRFGHLLSGWLKAFWNLEFLILGWVYYSTDVSLQAQLNAVKQHYLSESLGCCNKETLLKTLPDIGIKSIAVKQYILFNNF